MQIANITTHSNACMCLLRLIYLSTLLSRCMWTTSDLLQGYLHNKWTFLEVFVRTLTSSVENLYNLVIQITDVIIGYLCREKIGQRCLQKPEVNGHAVSPQRTCRGTRGTLRISLFISKLLQNLKSCMTPTPIGYDLFIHTSYSNTIRKNIDREYHFYVVNCYKYEWNIDYFALTTDGRNLTKSSWSNHAETV
jgi:hypothetical protein